MIRSKSRSRPRRDCTRVVLSIVLLAGLLPLARGAAREDGDEVHDVVVYGGTSAGVVAAVEAASLGRTVILIEPGHHLGGLSAGGLGATDIGNKGAIGGRARDFYHRIWKHYRKPEAWTRQAREDYGHTVAWDREETWWMFEPHVAERIFEDLIREAGVPVIRGDALALDGGVRTEKRRIEAIRLESGRVIEGRIFIDATYEGDLMAGAGVSYRVGRESNAEFRETLNGVQTNRARSHQFDRFVDPYRVPGDPESGLLPEIHPGGPGVEGSGDHRVQAYNFRLCLSEAPDNRIPFEKPEGYDPLRYELLLRYLLAGGRGLLRGHKLMPNLKSDTNNSGPFSTDFIGGNYAYPDGDHATRRAIIEEHTRYQKGLLYFLANDPRVPEDVHKAFARLGLARDEFRGNGHWPHQLYIREARRMRGGYVMTEANCRGSRLAEDPVGMGAYGMDSHNTQRYVGPDGRVLNEGDIQVHGFRPYPISFRSIIPWEGDCLNLVVPVCLSATHIAFGSIRMEPVFMVLGHSAGAVAHHALEEGLPVQRIDYPRLRERLLAEGQVLELPLPPELAVKASSLSGVVMDDRDAELTGDWTPSISTPRFVDEGYRHDGDRDKGEASARFSVNLPEAGRWRVLISWSPHTNRAGAVPVTVIHGQGKHVVRVDQRKRPGEDGLFHDLGVFVFEKDRPAVVLIENTGTKGHVIVDAVRFLPVGEDRGDS